MKPTLQLGQATTPQGEVIELLSHDGRFRIQSGRFTLCSSAAADAEKALGRVGTKSFLQCRNPRILVGGLRLGYTVRAVLDTLGKQRGEIHIAEPMPEFLDWHRTHLADLHGTPPLLDDTRLTIHEQPVEQILWEGIDCHAILIQADGAPRDEPACSMASLSAAYQNLRPDGLLCVLAPVRDKSFDKWLTSTGFEVTSGPVKASEKAKKPRFLSLWQARKN